MKEKNMRELKIEAMQDVADTLSQQRRPCDMDDVLNYKIWSDGRQDYIRLGDYYLPHLLRTVIKLVEGRYDKSASSEEELKSKISTQKTLMEEKDEAIYALDKTIKALRSQVATYEATIAALRNQEHYWRKAYDDKFNIQGHRYVFCNIPNNDEGREIVKSIKKYLNTESYTVRVKGQYLDDTTKQTEGWRKYSFGQPISKSKCLRVYIDNNKKVSEDG
jgi:hypothetical protein